MAQPLIILSVSPVEEDHRSLENIVGHSNWRLLRADGIPAARTLLADYEISVVLCESHLREGSWIGLLDELQSLPYPPCLIVTSATADERLWAEALNRGAWDVLAKPFNRSELVRCVKIAWENWYHRRPPAHQHSATAS